MRRRDVPLRQLTRHEVGDADGLFRPAEARVDQVAGDDASKKFVVPARLSMAFPEGVQFPLSEAADILPGKPEMEDSRRPGLEEPLLVRQALGGFSVTAVSSASTGAGTGREPVIAS